MIKNEPMPVRLSAFESPTILITIDWKKFFEIFPVLERDWVLNNSNNVKYPNEETVLWDWFASDTCKQMIKSALFSGAKISNLPESNWIFYNDNWNSKL